MSVAMRGGKVDESRSVLARRLLTHPFIARVKTPGRYTMEEFFYFVEDFCMRTPRELYRFCFQALEHIPPARVGGSYAPSSGRIELSLLEDKFKGHFDEDWDGNDLSIDCNRLLFRSLRGMHAELCDRYADLFVSTDLGMAQEYLEKQQAGNDKQYAEATAGGLGGGGSATAAPSGNKKKATNPYVSPTTLPKTSPIDKEKMGYLDFEAAVIERPGIIAVITNLQTGWQRRTGGRRWWRRRRMESDKKVGATRGRRGGKDMLRTQRVNVEPGGGDGPILGRRRRDVTSDPPPPLFGPGKGRRRSMLQPVSDPPADSSQRGGKNNVEWDRGDGGGGGGGGGRRGSSAGTMSGSVGAFLPPGIAELQEMQRLTRVADLKLQATKARQRHKLLPTLKRILLPWLDKGSRTGTVPARKAAGAFEPTMMSALGRAVKGAGMAMGW